MLMTPPSPRPARILGVGRYLPARVVTSDELAAIVGVAPGWIERNQGVHERRWVADETAPWMAAAAAREALEEAGLEPGDLDLILNASGTQPQAIPDGAALIQRELGLGESGVAAFSVHATCLSFMVGFDLASHLLASGAYRHILVVTADISSRALDFTQPEASTLFGDMAAAVVLGRAEQGSGSGVLAARMETFSVGADFTTIPGGGTTRHPNRPETRPEDNLFHMEGRKVARLSFRHAGEVLEHLRPGLSTGLGDLDWVIPHQASLLGIRALTKVYGYPEDRVITTLHRLGNCVAASIPGTLYEAVRSGRLQRDQTALMVGTGAGLSIGGLVFRY
ncbi:MAG: 3-oxoacyl-[acyl-carrier-protein] synthase III C-terminal domain-containing protein [Pseudomonadota bacterium]